MHQPFPLEAIEPLDASQNSPRHLSEAYTTEGIGCEKAISHHFRDRRPEHHIQLVPTLEQELAGLAATRSAQAPLIPVTESVVGDDEPLTQATRAAPAQRNPADLPSCSDCFSTSRR